MTTTEKLLRDIETLRNSIQRNWIDLDRLNLSKEEREGIWKNTEILTVDLQKLMERLRASVT